MVHDTCEMMWTHNLKKDFGLTILTLAHNYYNNRSAYTLSLIWYFKKKKTKRIELHYRFI